MHVFKCSTHFSDLVKNKWLIVVLNKNGQKLIQPNIPQYDDYGIYDELCSKIHY